MISIIGKYLADYVIKDTTKFNDAKKYFKYISGCLSARGIGASFSTAIGFIGFVGLFVIASNISPSIALTTFYGSTSATCFL